MSDREGIEALLAQYVERHAQDGVAPDLEGLCVDHPELLEPLRRLVAEYEAAVRVLDASGGMPSRIAEVGHRSVHGDHGADALTARGSEPPSRRIAPGRVLADRYRIVGLLGRGGLGEVWRAMDEKLGVEVALKALRRELVGNPRGLQLVRREVRVAREVISPNVCRIFDLVEVEGQELVSMELVDGETLLEVLRKSSPLPLGEAMELASQMLAGLGAIHDAGLVHRDIKPENVMVTRTGRVVVMDLGLARAVSETRTGSISGTPAYMAPEQAAGGALDARADVYAAGVVLAEMICPPGVAEHSSRERLWRQVQQDPPALPESPWQPVLARCLARRPEDRYPTAHALARALEHVTLRVSTDADVSPYPGLAAFTEADTEYFFGREAEIEALWRKLEGPPRLLAVVGASGAGKSSFLRAGILGTRPQGWVALRMTPGRSPSMALGEAVAGELAGDRSIAPLLVRFSEPEVAVDLLSRWRETAEHALLVVDQFEEIFTQTAPEARRSFVELLARLPLEAEILVVLGMRDDFLLACHEHEELAPLFSGLTPLRAPAGEALRRAIVQPALKCGYRFEDDALVDEMLEEVEGERGALPLLAFAASGLWEGRDREAGLLTRDAYRAIGGVVGALAGHAEATLVRIGPQRLPMVRELFRNLVTARGTRVSRTSSELASVVEDRDEARRILAELVDARLLTEYEVPAQGKEAEPEQRIEIIHESLLTAWPRLVRWQTQDADAAQMRDQVRQAARLWAEKGRAEELLWSGPAYRELVVWQERYPGRLTAVEQAFAEATRQLAGRRRRRRRAVAALVFVVMAIVALTLGLSWQRSEAARAESDRQALRAEASKVLALGRLELDSDPTAALAYATASLELGDEMPARRFALQALWRGPTRFRLGEAGAVTGGGVTDVTFSPDGRWLATGTRHGGILLWPRDGGVPRLLRGELAEPLVGLVEFTAASDRLLAVSQDRSVRLWSVSTGDLLWEWSGAVDFTMSADRTEAALYFPIPDSNPPSLELEVWSLEGAVPTRRRTLPYGRRPAAKRNLDGSLSRVVRVEGTGRQLLRLYDLKEPSAPPQTLGSHPARVVLTAFAGQQGLDAAQHPEREVVVSEDAGGEIRLWSLATERGEPARILNAGGAGIPFFDGPGSRVAVIENQVTRLWRLDPPEAMPLELRDALALDSARGSFHPSGRWLATGDFTGVALWCLGRPYPLVLLPSSDQGRFGLAVAPDDSWIATGAGMPRATVRVLPLVRGGSSRSWTVAGGVTNLAVLPGGRDLVAGSGGAVDLLPIGPGTPRTLEGFSSEVWGLAVSQDGRLVAAGGGQYLPEERLVRVWDLETGTSRVLEASRGNWATGLEFLPDGSLLEADPSGVRRWDLEAGTFETLREWDWSMGFVTASRDGRLVLSYGFNLDNRRSSVLWVDDLESGSSYEISSHGSAVFAAVFDPTGTAVITGDANGLIRVGPVDGGEPHLLFGHEAMVTALATTSDGRWIASTAYDGSVRLWPMPDITQPPLHTLPHDELLAKLRSLTNLRVVANEESATGYEVEVGPFPGWTTVPSW